MRAVPFGREGLGKKDDDHKPTKKPSIRSQWAAATTTPKRKLFRRLALLFALGTFVWVFIHNLPTDVPIRDRRRPVYRPELDPDKLRAPGAPGPMPKLKPDPKTQRPIPPPPNTPPPSAPPPSPPHPDTASSPAGYTGPLLFPKLRDSLQAIYTTGGASPVNKNVLFAAASLKSAALLLPLACDMGKELRNYVHFALFGGSEITLEDLRSINGLDTSCQLIFHDARPDFAATSTTERLRQSSTHGLHHIHRYMHPQALVVDASELEEDFFLAGIRKQAPVLGVPVIEVAENARSRLAWIAKLDSSSLAAWDNFSMDILIQAPPATSGSLIHLLKSLSAADFSAGSTPHLTIELPHDVDRATTEFLRTFQWPPGRSHLPSQPRQLTLRHRIPRSRVTEDEGSVRFLESFWPIIPRYSHVLVLSPQAELSPQFFHYLKFAALQYLYSGAARTQEWDSRLLGISLELPSTHLDGSKAFTPPPGKTGPTPFLWEAPSSNAILFSGQKWMELHALVTNLLDFQQRSQSLPPFFTDKLVSKRCPSWLELALKLSRARGYWTLYPSAPTAKNLATIHSELYRAPEEYEGELAKEPPGSPELPINGGGTLFESLPGGGMLLQFNEMPLLLWDGTPTSLLDLDDTAAAFTKEFRRAVGGCQSLAPEDLAPRPSTKDLFCMKEE